MKRIVLFIMMIIIALPAYDANPYIVEEYVPKNAHEILNPYKRRGAEFLKALHDIDPASTLNHNSAKQYDTFWTEFVNRVQNLTVFNYFRENSDSLEANAYFGALMRVLWVLLLEVKSQIQNPQTKEEKDSLRSIIFNTMRDISSKKENIITPVEEYNDTIRLLEKAAKQMYNILYPPSLLTRTWNYFTEYIE